MRVGGRGGCGRLLPLRGLEQQVVAPARRGGREPPRRGDGEVFVGHRRLRGAAVHPEGVERARDDGRNDVSGSRRGVGDDALEGEFAIELGGAAAQVLADFPGPPGVAHPGAASKRRVAQGAGAQGCDLGGVAARAFDADVRLRGRGGRPFGCGGGRLRGALRRGARGEREGGGEQGGRRPARGRGGMLSIHGCAILCWKPGASHKHGSVKVGCARPTRGIPPLREAPRPRARPGPLRWCRWPLRSGRCPDPCRRAPESPPRGPACRSCSPRRAARHPRRRCGRRIRAGPCCRREAPPAS